MIINSIPQGSVLIVHASFSPCRKENLTPRQVLSILLDRLGPDGTLILPTFSYNYSGIWNVEPYDRNRTPGLGNGILSETFRQMPGVIRSGNPTYSVAACGKYAYELTDGADDAAGLGHGSSFGKAMELGAKILLLNVGNNRNSMLHYVEAVSNLPYNDIPFRQCWGKTALTVNGEMKLKEEFPACSEVFSQFDEPLVQAGIAEQKDHSFLLDAQKMRDFVLHEITLRPDIMLCNDFTCEPCNLRRKRLRETGLI